jgi:L-amino acid N-acyltransferase YncA
VTLPDSNPDSNPDPNPDPNDGPDPDTGPDAMTDSADAVRLASVVRVRLATVHDAEPIRRIYNHEVENTTATMDLVPRSLADQRDWLAQRTGAFAAIVAVVDEPDGTGTAIETVAGFAALSPYKERAAYRTSVEDSVYVRRDLSGRGIGRLLLTEMLDVAQRSGFHSVMARIEASSDASRALHERCGFTLVGVEREIGRKFNRWLDVAVMQCLLTDRV